MSVLGYAVLGQTVLGQVEATGGGGGGVGLVTLAELTAHLGNTAAADATALQATLDSALSAVEAELGRPLAVRSVTERKDGGRAAVALNVVPCPCAACQPHRALTITAASENGTALTGTDYDLDDVSGLLARGQYGTRTWAAGRTRGITVTYSTGYASCPPWLRQAVLLEARRLWEARRGRSARQQVYAEDQAPVVQDISLRALLRPHQAPGF